MIAPHGLAFGRGLFMIREPLVKIAGYNINGINGRLDILLRWLKEEAPDIVCLQELKTEDAGGLRGDLARPKVVERRRHPFKGIRTDPHPARPSRRFRRQP
jgi:hypothetical protein